MLKKCYRRPKNCQKFAVKLQKNLQKKLEKMQQNDKKQLETWGKNTKKKRINRIKNKILFLPPQGEAWIGILGPDGATAVTYNVSQGQVVFFPRNAVHWVKNVGSSELLLLLFFSTHEELLTLDVDDAFYGTPEDVAARALKVGKG